MFLCTSSELYSQGNGQKGDIMTSTQTGPYPVLFARNLSTSRILLEVRLGNTHFRFAVSPGEIDSVPWVIAKSSGFQRMWDRGDLEVSDSYSFNSTLDELPDIGGGSGPVEWDEVEGRPSEFPPEAHTRSWGEIEGKPTTFPPSAHTHTAAQISDAGAKGREVIQAGTEAAARSAIGAGTSSVNLTNAVPAPLGKAGAGSSTTSARADHVHQAADAQADSTAEDVAGLVTDFNALLAKLRSAGIIES